MSSTVVPGAVPASFTRKLLAWMPTVLWLCALAAFSTDAFSAEHTGTILRRILHALFGEVSHHQIEQIHFFVRKTAHFGSYGLLSALAFFSWRATLPALPRWTFRWTSLALLLTLMAASLDEFHQTFVASRTGSLRDVVLDLTGAIFFQLVLAIWLGSRKPRLNQ